MRYGAEPAVATGSRDDIIAELRQDIRPGSPRSKRRQREAAAAIKALEAGAPYARTGHIRYVVTGEPRPYVVELRHAHSGESRLERIEARSDMEAWRMAHELANSEPGQVTAVYGVLYDD